MARQAPGFAVGNLFVRERVAYRLNLVELTLLGIAIALAALAILTDDSWISLVAVSLSLSATVLVLVAAKVRTHFEDSYTRP